MALTPRKRRFVDALGRGASNKEAAIEAGYSPATAGPAGSRLAKDADVLAELARRAKPKDAGVNTEALDVKPPAPPVEDDPQAYLLDLMNDGEVDTKLRLDAAKALMPYMHVRKGEAGKKAGRADAAKSAATGRFGQGAAPKVVPITR